MRGYIQFLSSVLSLLALCFSGTHLHSLGRSGIIKEFSVLPKNTTQWLNLCLNLELLIQSPATQPEAYYVSPCMTDIHVNLQLNVTEKTWVVWLQFWSLACWLQMEWIQSWVSHSSWIFLSLEDDKWHPCEYLLYLHIWTNIYLHICH